MSRQANNIFASIPLAAALRTRGIGFVGTLLQNRLRGCRLAFKKEVKTTGRGAHDVRVNSDETPCLVRWFDNRTITLPSNCVGDAPIRSVRRYDKTSKTHIHVPQPRIVATYNSYMGCVDLHNYLVQMCKYKVKSRRWYLYVFYRTVWHTTQEASHEAA